MIEPHFALATPMDIEYLRVYNAQPMADEISLVIICKPSPFSFESTKGMPWSYDMIAFVNG